VKRTKRAIRATKSERVPRLKNTLVELRRALRRERRNFRRASSLLEDPNREKRVKKLSPNVFSSFLTSLHEAREDDVYYYDDDWEKKNKKNKKNIQTINDKLLFEILKALDAEIQSFQKADADTLFARTKLARAIHATNRGIREMTRKTLATTAELGFSKACRVANEREVETLREELKEAKERNEEEENKTEIVVTTGQRTLQRQQKATSSHLPDTRRVNAYVPENDPSGIGLPIPFAPFHAVAPSKILRSNG